MPKTRILSMFRLTPLPARFLFLLDFSMECLINVIGIMMIRKIKVSGGMPIMETHLPPKYRRIGLFSLSAIRYMLGKNKQRHEECKCQTENDGPGQVVSRIQHCLLRKIYADSVLRTA